MKAAAGATHNEEDTFHKGEAAALEVDNLSQSEDDKF